MEIKTKYKEGDEVFCIDLLSNKSIYKITGPWRIVSIRIDVDNHEQTNIYQLSEVHNRCSPKEGFETELKTRDEIAEWIDKEANEIKRRLFGKWEYDG